MDFRFFDKLSKRMIYSSRCESLGKFFEQWESISENSKSPVMRYTGIDDICNRKIFEGDILSIEDKAHIVRELEIFLDDAFIVYGYKFCSGYFREDGISLERFYSYEPEIIGNIYES